MPIRHLPLIRFFALKVTLGPACSADVERPFCVAGQATGRDRGALIERNLFLQVVHLEDKKILRDIHLNDDDYLWPRPPKGWVTERMRQLRARQEARRRAAAELGAFPVLTPDESAEAIEINEEAFAAHPRQFLPNGAGDIFAHEPLLPDETPTERYERRMTQMGKEASEYHEAELDGFPLKARK
jgi:hypothetical protein